MAAQEERRQDPVHEGQEGRHRPRAGRQGQGRQGPRHRRLPKVQKVLVEGVGRVKKHTRISPTQRGAQQGGIVTQEAPIHVSNVMVIDSEDKPTRVGYRKDDEGRNIRVSRRTGKDL